MQRMTSIETRTAGERPRSHGSSDLIVQREYWVRFESYRREGRVQPLLMLGDAREVLSQLLDSSIDFAMTSPPYGGKREYESGGSG